MGDGALARLLDTEQRSLITAIDQSWAQIRARWLPAVELEPPAGPMSSIYCGYSLLFAPAFPSVAADRVVSLGVAARLIAIASFCTDAVIDDDALRAVARADASIRASALGFEAERILQTLFPAGARFWERLRELQQRTSSAILDEFPPDDGRPLAVATERGALQRASDRSSLAMLVPYALAELAGDERPLDRLIPSIAHYYRGRQMVDDLHDWRDDARAGRPSHLLVLAGATGAIEDDGALDRLGARIEAELTDRILAIADRELSQARELAAGTGAAPGRRALEAILASYREMRRA